jgi:hypothetical protein
VATGIRFKVTGTLLRSDPFPCHDRSLPPVTGGDCPDRGNLFFEILYGMNGEPPCYPPGCSVPILFFAYYGHTC